MKQVRCAIYTRKSSEDGLEQSFNSLDAQREACAAYVLSQASEGWSALPDAYDDGGLSGGSLERPALQRLLADITAGRIDIVVVYKVDRLTRSLFDFAKLVETFDRAEVSFVSITQSFNTTTSMGRLTLNMLLSFAQFEREVTAERIRDKISASKAKGMWMGGLPPLGYEPDGRSLKIVPAQAALVRRIYERYLALGNVRLVAGELEREQMFSPRRTLSSGRPIGGRPFSRGQLHYILKSPIYAGDIPHKGEVHAGLHEAIIERGLWERVQAALSAHVKGTRRGMRTASTSPLSGKVFDAAGAPLIAAHACKGSRRYRYYVGSQQACGRTLRIPAAELEGAVGECLARALDAPVELCATAGLELEPAGFGALSSKSSELAAILRQRGRSGLRELLSAVHVHEEGLEIELDVPALAAALGLKIAEGAGPPLRLTSQAQLKRSGLALRLVHTSGASLQAAPSAPLIKLLVKARRWWAELRSGEIDVTRLASREGVTSSYLTRVVRLAFLSPQVVDAALAGTIKAQVGGHMLTATDAISLDWTRQARTLLPAASV
jgi:site-specific DNA recombinase